MLKEIHLKGEDIYLRKINVNDVNDRYHQWLNDPMVNQYLETRFTVQTKEAIRNFVISKESSSSEILLAICDKKLDLHIGNIKLGVINNDHLRSEISLLLGDKNYWGKGIATQAINLVCQFAFDYLKLNKLTAGSYESNIASIKAFKHCGFKVEGEFEDFFQINNKGEKLIVLGITAKKFNQKISFQS